MQVLFWLFSLSLLSSYFFHCFCFFFSFICFFFSFIVLSLLPRHCEITELGDTVTQQVYGYI